MKIYALSGVENSGKSTTLIRLVNQLKESYTLIREEARPGADVMAVLCSPSGRKIGITTRGDDSCCIEDDFNYLGEAIQECDLLICACRTKGSSIHALSHRHRNALLLLKATGETEEEREEANAYDLHRLLAEIEK